MTSVLEMQPKLAVLKLLLDGVGVEPVVADVDDRKRVQKAVYVAQRAGVDLGYRYSWYIMGPYSRSLTKDYFELADALDGEKIKGELRADSREKLQSIQPLMTPPKGVDLPQEDWLELVASYDYLRTVSGFDEEGATETIRRKKPALFNHLPAAKEQVKKYLPVA